MNIPLQRLHNQRLIQSEFKTPAEVVNWLGAVQAQEYSPSLWSISQRIKGKFLESDIEAAIKNREIVRTWPMRGTLHFVPASDAKWMVKLMGERINRKMASYYKKAELDEKLFNKCFTLLSKNLTSAKSLTRPEIYGLFEKNKIETKNMRGLFILGNLAQKGLLCFGEKKDKQQTFVLLDEWIQKPNSLEGTAAISEMVLRYFRSHGPASLKDFCWWSGLTLKEALSGIEEIKSKLIFENINGKEYIIAESFEEIKVSDSLFLLSTYDEYVVAYKDRSDIMPASSNNLNFNGGFTMTLCINGKVEAMARRTFEKDKTILSIRPVRKFTKKEVEKIQTEVKSYSEFFNKSSFEIR